MTSNDIVDVDIDHVYKVYYGSQNKNMTDPEAKQEHDTNYKELTDSLEYVIKDSVDYDGTYFAPYLYKTKYIIVGTRPISDRYPGEIGTENVCETIYSDYKIDKNKIHTVYVRNFRIKGLDLSDVERITVEIGGQQINKFYDFQIDICNKEFIKYTDKIPDEIVLPIDILPIPLHHQIKIRVWQKINHVLPVHDMKLEYDIYFSNNEKFNTATGDIKLLMNQAQYCGGPFDGRLNYNHPIDTMCIKYKENKRPEEISLLINGKYKLKLKLNYVLNDFYVYKFDKYVNFSQIDNAKFIDQDNKKLTDNEIDTEFCTNIQMMCVRSCMAGLMFSK